MTIFFWQNIVSMHQKAFFEALAEEVDVWLIYCEKESQYRKEMGWATPRLEKVNLISIEDVGRIEYMFAGATSNVFHVFSGINAYKPLRGYFEKLYKINPSRVGIFAERPGDTSTVKNLLRKLLYRYYSFKYRKLSFIVTPGGHDYFIGCGFSKDRVFRFAYFSKNVSFIDFAKTDSTDMHVRFVYVGALIKRKNVALLLNSIAKLKHIQQWTLDIIGDGPEMQNLIFIAKELCVEQRVSFLGNIENDKVRDRLREYDCLVLPSIIDGWGYVANEALSNGLYVICSDTCGVSEFVSSQERSGLVFENGNEYSLANAMQSAIDKKMHGVLDKGIIAKIHDDMLSGAYGASYFIDILKYANGMGYKPSAKWIVSAEHVF